MEVRQLVVLLEKLLATELELSRTIAFAEFESACGKVEIVMCGVGKLKKRLFGISWKALWQVIVK